MFNSWALINCFPSCSEPHDVATTRTHSTYESAYILCQWHCLLSFKLEIEAELCREPGEDININMSCWRRKLQERAGARGNSRIDGLVSGVVSVSVPKPVAPLLHALPLSKLTLSGLSRQTRSRSS